MGPYFYILRSRQIVLVVRWQDAAEEIISPLALLAVEESTAVGGRFADCNSYSILVPAKQTLLTASIFRFVALVRYSAEDRTIENGYVVHRCLFWWQNSHR
jgi:hypothetical protein